jgi:hypothetical protein
MLSGLMLMPVVVTVMVRGRLPLPPYLLALGHERKPRQRGHARGQSAKHDHQQPLEDVVRAIFDGTVAGGGGGWPSNTSCSASDSAKFYTQR